MFKKTLIIGLGMVLGFAGLCLANGTETAISTETIEPELVFEYKFDEPIVDVIFDEATMTVKEARELGMKGLEQSKVTEMVTVQYPRVLITEKAVKFLDERRNVKREISFHQITPKGWLTKVKGTKDCIGILSHIFRYKGEKSSEAKFTMVRIEGEILWEIDLSEVGYNLPYIAPNGQYIICTGDITGDYCRYLPSLWNEKGMIKELFGEEFYETINWGGAKFELRDCTFNEDGSQFAVVVCKKIWDHNRKEFGGKSFFALFDNKGNEIWRRDIENPSSVEISDDGMFVLVVGGPLIPFADGITGPAFKETLYLFNNKGNLLWNEKIHPGTNFKFSKDKKNLFGASGWNHLYLFDTLTGEIKWEYEGKGIKRKFRGIANTPNFEYILVGAPNYGKRNDSIFILNTQSKLLKEFKVGHFIHESFYPYVPYLNISSDGKKILIYTEKGVEVFQNIFIIEEKK